MRALMEDLVMENRSIMGPGYDRALERLGRDLALTVHEVPSGEDVWTWKVPPAWDVREAWFEADGVRYADVGDHPLHLRSYSLPFSGRVSRAEMLRHITTDPLRPDAIPFDYRYYDRTWGFCLEHARAAELVADFYDVHIDTIDITGTLKVGEHVIRGRSDDSILLVAHLDHPGMAIDDLSGVAVALEVARRQAGWVGHHTLRFLFLPEHIGSIAYLARNEALLPTFRHGLFLEMLGLDQPHALQRSRQDDAPVDRAVRAALVDSGAAFVEDAFLKIICNDEQVINGPGVDIPTASLSRARLRPVGSVDLSRPGDAKPYPEYHTSHDSLDLVSWERMEESVVVVQRALQILDTDGDSYPRRLYRGTVQLSRYGLWVDYTVDPALNAKVVQLMRSFEGDKPISRIALELELPVETVRGYVQRFVDAGLVELHRGPV